MIKRFGFSFLFFAASCGLKAQDADSLLARTDESLLTYSDSLSIFHLIDSLLTLEDNTPASQLATRLTYNSNVLSAGRTLGIEQFGLSPGMAFYHTTGIFADVSAYWSKDFDPEYYLTILSLGYMHTFTDKFSIITGYDRYFYNTKIEDAFIPYKNGVSLSPYLELKPFYIRTDYTYYFGDKKVHRILPSFGVTLEKKGFLKIDKVAFMPSVYLLFGNEILTEIRYERPSTLLEARNNIEKYGTVYRPVAIERSVFGLMNYAFSFPLSIQHKNWSFNFSYAYNIPRAVDDEPHIPSASSFLSGGITYYINLKKNKEFIF